MHDNTISNFFAAPDDRGEELITMRAVDAADLEA